VVAQAQSFYQLNPTTTSTKTPPSTKEQKNIVFDSPDLYTTLSTIELNNEIQYVSPMGMFSEVFCGASFCSPIINGVGSSIMPASGHAVFQASTKIDMICYPRIISDTNLGSSNLINPTFTSSTQNMDTTYFSNGRYYTGWSSWRNSPTGNITPNIIHTISNINPSATLGTLPRQKIWSIMDNSTIYSQSGTGGDFDFQDAGVQNWQEPLYVINIVDNTAVVPVTNVQSYYMTECYVKMVSIIGVGNGGTQSFPLVDERWEDCIPALLSTDQNANTSSYVYITNASNNDTTVWLNVTYLSSAVITTIQNDIATNGFYTSTNKCGNPVNVTGIYTHSISSASNNPSAGNNLYTLIFNYNYVPNGYNIVVQYDPCTNVEVFGGDTYIGEYNYPVIDGLNAGAYITTPLPYRGYQLNELTVIPWNQHDITNSNNSGLEIQGWNIINQTVYQTIQPTGNIRQLICNGIIESRTNTAMAYSSSPASLFPTTNYILRPLGYNSPDYSAGSMVNISNSYFSDYPGYSYPFDLGYGGFATFQEANGGLTFNNDYSENPNNNLFVSKPATGFTEQLTFCSLVIYSTQRATNQQNSPNLKNFPVLNQYTLDDATGEIKRAYSQVDKYGENLYAITESGIALLLTNKQLLTEQSGQTLAAIGNSDSLYIQDAQFVSRSVGMNDQMWRSAAEWNNQLWFANYSSVYKFSAAGLVDIEGDFSAVLRNILPDIASGYGSEVLGMWDNKYKEYRLNISNTKILITTAGTQFFYSQPNAPSGTQVFQDSIIDYQSSGLMNIENINQATVTEIFVINNTGGNILVKWANAEPDLVLPAGATYRLFWNGLAWTFDFNFQNLCNDLVYSETLKGWTGNYKFLFDQYTSDIKDNVYGMRYGASYLLDSSFIMNGAPVGAWFLQVCSPKEMFNISKEFIRIRINANNSPDIVNYFQSIEDFNNNNVFANMNTIIAPLALKNYGMGWTNLIPRGQNYPYLRNQGRYTLFQVTYQQPEDWYVSSTEFEYRNLIYP
jgi:hypothetical protein